MSTQEIQEVISPKFDESVILGIVKKYFPDLTEISIKKINIDTASTKGDSYLSVACRVCFEILGKTTDGTVSEKSIPVFVKSLPKNIGRRKTFRSTDFFENEVIFYKEVWPRLNDFQIKKNPDNIFKGIPMFLSAHIDGANDYIALEDLSYKNYVNIKRTSGLNVEDAAFFMKLFAKFHGLSLAFKLQNPDEFEKAATALRETYFAEMYRSWYINYQQMLCIVVRDAVEKELPEKYFKKIDKLFHDDLFGILCKQCEVRGPFSVITHGDTWLPNFLIKYGETNVPVDVVMVDFQFTRYTTLSTDLTFFLYVCTENKLREEHWDDLIRCYHDNLCKTLSDLGSDPNVITLEALQADISKNAVFGIGVAVEAVTMSLLDENQVADLDSIQGDLAVPTESVCVVKPFDSPEKRKRLADTFKHAIDKGFI